MTRTTLERILNVDGEVALVFLHLRLEFFKIKLITIKQKPTVIQSGNVHIVTFT